MNSPRCYRVTFWDRLPASASGDPLSGAFGFLSSSLAHGSQEHESRAAAEEAAILGVSKGAVRADLSAVYRRTVRRLGSYTPGNPSTVSAVWWEA